MVKDLREHVEDLEGRMAQQETRIAEQETEIVELRVWQRAALAYIYRLIAHIERDGGTPPPPPAELRLGSSDTLPPPPRGMTWGTGNPSDNPLEIDL